MSSKKVFPLLRSSVNTLVSNPIVLFPYCIIGFVHLLVLEVLFFAPRNPLKTFFGPIVTKIWSEDFLHYPLNFILLPEVFQKVQYPLYIFVSSFCVAVSIAIIVDINNGDTVNVSKVFKKGLSSYIHVIVATSILFALVFGMSYGYSLIYERALLIRSESGKFFMLKQLIVDGASYFSLVINIVCSTLFAYVIPIIVIEKKKVFAAIALNIKTLWKSFFFTFFIIFIPTLFYIPIILLRNSIAIDKFVPEFTLVVLIAQIIVMLCIEAINYTAITTYYLIKKENA